MQGNYKFVLAGNPNSGKTTFYNSCTGEKRRASNRPGVTVDVAEGCFRIGETDIFLSDIPGIYSVDNDTAEEKLAADFLKNEKYDLIINIIDAVCIERSLFLTTQLAETGKPVVASLNMTDAAKKRGLIIDCEKLSQIIGIPVIPASARNKTKVADFIKKACFYAEKNSESIKYRKFVCAEERYSFIEDAIQKCVTRTEQRAFDLDKIFTNKILGLPVFLFVMVLVFSGTYYFGGFFSDLLTNFISYLKNFILGFLVQLGTNGILISFIGDGCIAGVGSVLSFVPQIFFLFLFLAILEDTGYMARASYLADGIMSGIGLSGKSFVPIMLGFGCTVPAVLACRTLETKREQEKTLRILPFIPCSARLPLFIMLLQTYFGENALKGTIIIYFSGIIAAAAIGKAVNVSERLFKKNAVNKARDDFMIIELPRYALPSLSSVIMYAGHRTVEFLKKAGSVIFVASGVIWILLNIGPGGYVLFPEKSFGGIISEKAAVLLTPCGLGFWQIAMALIAGIAAKELTASCIFMVFSQSGLTIKTALSQIGFGVANAAAMITFVLLYIPCAATISAISSELQSKGVIFKIFIRHILVAYIAAMLVYWITLFIL